MSENEISNLVIEACIKIHRALGPGLLESAYQRCLYHELTKLGLKVEQEKRVGICYDDIEIERGYRIDLLVEGKVVIELKSISTVLDVHKSQVLTYLRLGNYKLGLLTNFNEKLLKDGIHRVVNGL